MSIAAAAVLVGGSLTPSGGSSEDLTSLGIVSGVHRAIFNGSTFLDRSEAAFSVSEPKIKTDAPNGYTQQRCTMKLKFPLALDNGNSTFNTVEVKVSYDPETTASEVAEMCGEAAQFLVSSDLTSFWDSQSLE
jgi:hypothetical protein